MPIGRSGAIGGVSVLAMPGRTPRSKRVAQFKSASFNATSLYISGVTMDGNGAALASCSVHLFRTSDDVEIALALSDASGNYSFPTLVGGPFYIVAYKSGAPDVSGTTVNTLVGA